MDKAVGGRGATTRRALGTVCINLLVWRFQPVAKHKRSITIKTSFRTFYFHRKGSVAYIARVSVSQVSTTVSMNIFNNFCRI